MGLLGVVPDWSVRRDRWTSALACEASSWGWGEGAPRLLWEGTGELRVLGDLENAVR